MPSSITWNTRTEILVINIAIFYQTTKHDYLQAPQMKILSRHMYCSPQKSLPFRVMSHLIVGNILSNSRTTICGW
jgi:hypothetical protein